MAHIANLKPTVAHGDSESLSYAIQSLDTLNDQIVQFIFTPKSSECDNVKDDRVINSGTEHPRTPERDSLKSSLALMRRLLVDAQNKFRKMVEENKKLASKIDSSIQTAKQEVSCLRNKLEDTNKRLSQISDEQMNEMVTNDQINNDQDNKEWQKKQDEQELSRLRERFSELEVENKRLQSQIHEMKSFNLDGTPVDITDESKLQIQLTQTQHELSRAKEALTAMKNDRKRLKGEKVDLLNQMKQLYCTLEAKEEEMRDFIRNYEQKMAEMDNKLKQIKTEKEEVEKDRWEILKRAREAAERSVTLREQLDAKGKQNEALEAEMEKIRKLITSERHSSLTTPHITVTSSPLSTSEGSLDTASVQGPDGNLSQITKDGSVVNTPMSDSGTPPHSARSTRSFISVPQMLSKKLFTSSSVYLFEVISTDSESRELLLSASEPTSRSTEDLSNINKLQEKETKKKKKKFISRSLSKMFAKKNKALMEELIYDDTSVSRLSITSSKGSTVDLAAMDEAEKQRLAEKAKTLPMVQWKANMVVAWLEYTMDLPQYSRACAENVKSGTVLLSLSDPDLESGMGITNILHKRKLKLAIEEFRHPDTNKYPSASELDHRWVAHTWLKDLGLCMHSAFFDNARVDGQVLNTLNKKDLEKLLNVTRKFHQVSISHGVELLRIIKFNKKVLAERRAQCEDTDTDPVVWTTGRVIKWTRTIDLQEYSDNLKDSGVHGALLVLEPTFDADAMASALGIPNGKTIIRRHLTTELNAIIRPARAAIHVIPGIKEDKRKMSGSNNNFQRSYRMPNDSSKSKPIFRGSLGRALGRKMKNDMDRYQPSESFKEHPEKLRSKSTSQELSSTPV